MKKTFFILSMCAATIGYAGAQKANVDQAIKLGKAGKVAEARALIDQAISNPETSSDIRTYLEGGKIEFDNFDKANLKFQINPKDESVNPVEMAGELLRGYDMYMKALPLDSVPNAKGEIKPKESKKILQTLNGHYNDFFNAGGTYYNEKKFYPEAYTAFMIFGEFPSSPYANKVIAATPDSVVNTAFFNAGLSAYAGNQLDESARAFKAGRLNNSDNPQNYIYEIACWQFIARNDSTRENEAKNAIEEVAKSGHQKFGMSQPLFLNNLVNSLVQDNKGVEAIALVNKEIEANPQNSALYGLRGYVNDRLDNDEASVADYRKALSFDDADFETLKNASKKIFKTGTELLNQLEGRDIEKRQAIKAEYFDEAKKAAQRAYAMNDNDSDLIYVIENIDYALETYF